MESGKGPTLANDPSETPTRRFYDFKDKTDRVREEIMAENLRETKWELVWELRGLGHDFRATPEGMDVVLSSPPNMNWN